MGRGNLDGAVGFQLAELAGAPAALVDDALAGATPGGSQRVEHVVLVDVAQSAIGHGIREQLGGARGQFLLLGELNGIEWVQVHVSCGAIELGTISASTRIPCTLILTHVALLDDAIEAPDAHPAEHVVQSHAAQTHLVVGANCRQGAQHTEEGQRQRGN